MRVVCKLPNATQRLEFGHMVQLAQYEEKGWTIIATRAKPDGTNEVAFPGDVADGVLWSGALMKRACPSLFDGKPN